MTLEAEHTMVIPDAGIRASDAERRDCAEALKAHFAEGRLDQEEFDERLGAAMGAKTRGELAALFADLPRSPRRPPTPGPRTRSRPPLFVVAGIAFFIAFVMAAFASVSGHAGRTVFAQSGPGIGRVVVQSPNLAVPFFVLAAVVLCVVGVLARRHSPRRFDR